jgi:genome maintenance exonuclease 1
MFNHIHHDIPKLKRIDAEDGRVYETPTGKKYPSVTSVVGILGKREIMEWRERVGEEEANRISTRATKRGTAIHSLCEGYLKNEEVNPSIFDLEMFTSIKPILNKIDNVRCLETQLFSHHLRVAGTVDCVADFEGKISIIDFKSSRRVKTRDEIETYFLQTSAYSVMFEELTGIPITRLVIIMGVDNDKPLTFIEHRDDWIDKFIEVRQDYLKLYKK